MRTSTSRNRHLTGFCDLTDTLASAALAVLVGIVVYVIQGVPEAWEFAAATLTVGLFASPIRHAAPTVRRRRHRSN